MTPLISIILPTFNGGKYIGTQIESILAQTHSNFELLIVDDGSQDDTVAEIDRLQKGDRRIRVMPSDTCNKGQKVRLLQLLREATGQLIAFSDQDDVWAPNKLELLHARIGHADLAFGPSKLIDGQGNDIGCSLLEAMGLPLRPGDRLHALFHPTVSAHAMLVRREALSVGAFCRSSAFDWLIALDASYSAGLMYVEEAVTSHRIHETNQNNGGVRHVPALKHRPSYTRLPRWALPSGELDRFVLWNRFDYLGTSPVVPDATRRVFARLTAQCEQAWFVDRGPLLRSANRQLKETLGAALRPFAGSAQDWQDCERLIEIMTSSWRTIKPSHVTR